METLTFTSTIRGNLGVINAPPIVIQADAEESVANTIGIGATVVETLAIDVSQIVAFYMLSDRDLVVTTNAAAQTFNLVANQPFFWHDQMSGACPITTDVTTLHLDNSAGAVAANFKAEFLLTVAS